MICSFNESGKMKNIIKPLFDALCRRNTPEDKLRAVLRKLMAEHDRINKNHMNDMHHTYDEGSAFCTKVLKTAFDQSKNESEQGSLLDTMIRLNYYTRRSRKGFMAYVHDQTALQNQEAQNIKFIMAHTQDIDRAINSIGAQTKINSAPNPYL